jgi:hypothetical protein
VRALVSAGLAETNGRIAIFSSVIARSAATKQSSLSFFETPKEDWIASSGFALLAMTWVGL